MNLRSILFYPVNALLMAAGILFKSYSAYCEYAYFAVLKHTLFSIFTGDSFKIFDTYNIEYIYQPLYLVDK